jgi:hypothetical protein
MLIEDTRGNSSQPSLPQPPLTVKSANCSRRNSGRSGTYRAGANAVLDYINGKYTFTDCIIVMKKPRVVPIVESY